MSALLRNYGLQKHVKEFDSSSNVLSKRNAKELDNLELIGSVIKRRGGVSFRRQVYRHAVGSVKCASIWYGLAHMPGSNSRDCDGDMQGGKRYANHCLPKDCVNEVWYSLPILWRNVLHSQLRANVLGPFIPAPSPSAREPGRRIFTYFCCFHPSSRKWPL